jgi:hypothetical protein
VQLMEPIRIPTDVCICAHWRIDHVPSCTVIEGGKDCECAVFAPNDDWGYSFTDNEGRKLEGFA